MEHRHVTLAHGNGGRLMRELIQEVFAGQLDNPGLDVSADAVPLALPAGEPVFTTDGFTVQPLEFPGGDIGSLAVHGTTNDLAVVGADPLFLSLNAFIEEGLAIDCLERIVASISHASAACGAKVVAGDTKVVRRGEGSGLYLATTGVGIRASGVALDLRRIRAGDRILVSGPVGDHGVAVMLAREEFGMRGELRSDASSVLPLTRAARLEPRVKFMRDPTRGGLATVAHEIVQATGLQVVLDGPAIPVRDAVESVCEILGFDPLFMACEGRVVAVLAPDVVEPILQAWRACPEGEQAAVIGELRDGTPRVGVLTDLGGERILEELEDDPLPRIC